jgi:rare lipoprotein A
MTQDLPFTERGLASWYGRKFQGRRTSSGEPYDMFAMTAAHPTLPIPSYARVRNPANGREVVVRVNDRGPFHAGRIIDLSYTAALKLDLLRGVAPVEVERITFDEIRAGTWRRAPDDARYARQSPSGGVAAVVVPTASTAAVAASADEMRVARTPPPAAMAVAPVVQTGADVATAARSTPQAAGVTASPSRGYWVQLGAFRERAGALDFQRQVADALAWISPHLVVVDDAALFRLQAGPYPTREEARGAADGVRSALSLVPVIVERR